MAWSLPEGLKGFPERPGKVVRAKVDEALSKKIKAALEEWVVRMSYNVVWEDEDDDKPTISDDIAYKDIREDHIVVANGAPVGVLLEHVVYYSNSSSTDTYIYVLYFRDAPDHDLMLEGARIGRNSVEGTCFYSLRRREEVPQGARLVSENSEIFPVPKVFC